MTRWFCPPTRRLVWAANSLLCSVHRCFSPARPLMRLDAVCILRLQRSASSSSVWRAKERADWKVSKKGVGEFVKRKYHLLVWYRFCLYHVWQPWSGSVHQRWRQSIHQINQKRLSTFYLIVLRLNASIKRVETTSLPNSNNWYRINKTASRRNAQTQQWLSEWRLLHRILMTKSTCSAQFSSCDANFFFFFC